MKLTRPVLLASAVLAATLVTGCSVNPVVSKSSSSGSTVTPAAEDPTPTASANDAFELTEKATYKNKITVALSGFTRGISSEYASPSRSDYIKFNVTVFNGSGASLDLNTVQISAAYGDNSAAGDEVYDTDKGLGGTPSTHLLPGKTAQFAVAYVIPKKETALQVEVTPDFESEPAIFAGTVAK